MEDKNSSLLEINIGKTKPDLLLTAEKKQDLFKKLKSLHIITGTKPTSQEYLGTNGIFCYLSNKDLTKIISVNKFFKHYALKSIIQRGDIEIDYLNKVRLDKKEEFLLLKNSAISKYNKKLQQMNLQDRNNYLILNKELEHCLFFKQTRNIEKAKGLIEKYDCVVENMENLNNIICEIAHLDTQGKCESNHQDMKCMFDEASDFLYTDLMKAIEIIFTYSITSIKEILTIKSTLYCFNAFWSSRSYNIEDILMTMHFNYYYSSTWNYEHDSPKRLKENHFIFYNQLLNFLFLLYGDDIEFLNEIYFYNRDCFDFISKPNCISKKETVLKIHNSLIPIMSKLESISKELEYGDSHVIFWKVKVMIFEKIFDYSNCICTQIIMLNILEMFSNESIKLVMHSFCHKKKFLKLFSYFIQFHFDKNNMKKYKKRERCYFQILLTCCEKKKFKFIRTFFHNLYLVNKEEVNVFLSMKNETNHTLIEYLYTLKGVTGKMISFLEEKQEECKYEALSNNNFLIYK